MDRQDDSGSPLDRPIDHAETSGLIDLLRDAHMDPRTRVEALWVLYVRMTEGRMTTLQAYQVVRAYWAMEESCASLWGTVLRERDLTVPDPSRRVH